MTTTRNLNVNVKLRIDEDLRDELARLAVVGERNLAQEMRRALRAYVRAAGAENVEQAPRWLPIKAAELERLNNNASDAKEEGATA